MFTDEYYEMLKLRALFCITVGVCIESGGTGYDIETVDQTIEKLYIFANEKLREDNRKYYPLFLKLIPHVKEKKAVYFYENEKTINDLINFVGSIKSVEIFDVLMEDLDTKDVKNSIELAKAYYCHYYPSDNFGYSL